MNAIKHALVDIGGFARKLRDDVASQRTYMETVKPMHRELIRIIDESKPESIKPTIFSSVTAMRVCS